MRDLSRSSHLHLAEVGDASCRSATFTTTMTTTTTETKAETTSTTELPPDGEPEAAGDARSSLLAALRRFFASFRVRLLAGYIGLLAVATILAVVIANEALERRLDQRIDEALVQESRELRQLARGNDPETGERFAGDAERIFEVFLASKRPVPQRGVSHLRRTESRFLRSSQVTPYRLDQDPELVCSLERRSREGDRGERRRRRPARSSTSPSRSSWGGQDPRRLRGGDLPRP